MLLSSRPPSRPPAPQRQTLPPPPSPPSPKPTVGLPLTRVVRRRVSLRAARPPAPSAPRRSPKLLFSPSLRPLRALTAPGRFRCPLAGDGFESCRLPTVSNPSQMSRPLRGSVASKLQSLPDFSPRASAVRPPSVVKAEGRRRPRPNPGLGLLASSPVPTCRGA